VTEIRRTERRKGRKSGSSKIDAIASRQRDWRIIAKSLTEMPVVSAHVAISARRVIPSPFQVDPSITRRSAAVNRSLVAWDVNGGSPGHQTMTGKSWMISGVTSAWR
jgi:hypothetical protein